LAFIIANSYNWKIFKLNIHEEWCSTLVINKIQFALTTHYIIALTLLYKSNEMLIPLSYIFKYLNW